MNDTFGEAYLLYYLILLECNRSVDRAFSRIKLQNYILVFQSHEQVFPDST
jgi:hypothetical protein